MIQIESVVIRELRGIRELEIEPQRKTFVVSRAERIREEWCGGCCSVRPNGRDIAAYR